MTREEKINIIRVKSAVRFAIDDLKRGARDFDCSWLKGTIKSLETCMQLLSKLKV